MPLVALAALFGCSSGSDTSSAGSGGTTTSTSASSGTGVVECNSTADCPDPGNPCLVRTCWSGVCGTQDVPVGTVVGDDNPGDCKSNVCGGSDGVVLAPNDADTPDDDNSCTTQSCLNGAKVTTNLSGMA